MLEKKGNCSVAVRQQEVLQPISTHLSEVPEEDDELTANTSATSSSKSNSHFHLLPIKEGKGHHQKSSSYHSSDEIIDEEDLLAVSETDNGIPIIPGMISTSDVDVDSAFEDSIYSGSSDDKNRNNLKISKSNRSRSCNGGRHCGAAEQNVVGTKSEIEAEPKEDRDQGHFHHEELDEPVLFHMEVSPIPEQEIMPTNDSPRRSNCSLVYPNRHVHYNDHEDDQVGELYSDEERSSLQNVDEPLETILLSPSPPPSLTPPEEKLMCQNQFQSAVTTPSTLALEWEIKRELEETNKAPLPPHMQVKADGENIMNNCATEHQQQRWGSRKNSLTLGDEENGDFEVVYVPPDGGWGWMVLFGSIIVNILIPGTVKSFGILFVEFIEVFNASPAAAAWIPALSYWLYSSMGPFAGALATKYSHRSVTIVGGLLASVGLMLSYFATSIPYLYVSYGIIGGLGAGLAYPIGVFMVGQYFEKRRGLANGLCMSGSALGSVLVPPLLRVLLSSYGYRGAILIMGGILLNVCVGAMFYEPVSKHMKKQFIPREKNKEEVVGQQIESVVPVATEQPPSSYPQRQATNPIPRTVNKAPMREIAASMPIAIPLPPQNINDFRDLLNRRGSNGGRKATFQIGHEDDSWSYKSNELASPSTARLVKEEVGPNSPNRWGFYNPKGITVHGHLPCSSNDSNPELETLITSTSTGALPPSTSGATGGTSLSLSGVGASRGQSRLNLTAIPEDDDTSSESASRQVDWTFYSALPAAKQRLLRLSVGGGTQLMGSHSGHPSSSGLVNQTTGLSRTMSVASNVSNSSFHYMSTIHHGSLLTAMQYDKNLPEFASTLTLKSIRESCCPKLATLKGLIRKITCGLWPKVEPCDEQDRREMVRQDLPPPVPSSSSRPKPKFYDRLKKFIDLSLLKDGIYLIMLVSNSTTAVGYTNFIVLLPAYAKDMGFDKSAAASLLSIVAAFDFVGRIGGAALSDLQFVSRRWYYIIGLFFSGVALSFLPLAETFPSLVAMCAAFGLASGTYIGVTAVILADQLGAEKLGSSYGISLFFNGLLQLIGPPICGALNQQIGDLKPIFTGLGVTLIFGSLLWILAPFIERRRTLKEKLRMETPTAPPPSLPPLNAGGGDAPAKFVQNVNSDTIITTTRSETSLV